MSDFFYRKLNAYQYAMTLVMEIHQLIRSFPTEEKFGLCDQLRRAAISVPSNIAEGMGRASIKERIHFLEIAYGSLMETMCQLEIAQTLGYMQQEDFQRVEASVTNTAKTLSGLRASMTEKINHP